jgi:CxxC-x17-CxxC domain-containing protein
MTTTYTDRELRCRICGRTFVFSAGEQQYFGRRGFQTPTRCPECRVGTARRPRGGMVRRPNAAAAPRPAPSPSQPARTWATTCFRCGMATQVTFLPREDALIYCQACLDEVLGPFRRRPVVEAPATNLNGNYPPGD